MKDLGEIPQLMGTEKLSLSLLLSLSQGIWQQGKSSHLSRGSLFHQEKQQKWRHRNERLVSRPDSSRSYTSVPKADYQTIYEDITHGHYGCFSKDLCRKVSLLGLRRMGCIVILGKEDEGVVQKSKIVIINKKLKSQNIVPG